MTAAPHSTLQDQQTRGPGLRLRPHLTQAANTRISPEGSIRAPLAALAWRRKDSLGADPGDGMSQHADPEPGTRLYTVGALSADNTKRTLVEC